MAQVEITMSTNISSQLPKKQMGAGALLLNQQGQILIVKPIYQLVFRLISHETACGAG
jgi:hypothetical protein